MPISFDDSKKISKKLAQIIFFVFTLQPKTRTTRETHNRNIIPFPPSRYREMDAHRRCVFSNPPPTICLIINELQRLCYDKDFCDKTQGRQSWRLATELSQLGKNKFIRLAASPSHRLAVGGAEPKHRR